MESTLFDLRLLAAQKGLQKFIAPHPCKYGHEPVRYTASGACVQCALKKANAEYIAKKKALNKARA